MKRILFCIIIFQINFIVYAQNWSEVQKIVASDRGVGDWFGAPISISGNYAIISSKLEDEDTLGLNTLSNSGSAYIFEREINGVWNEVQKIVASDRAIDDQFGSDVSISGNFAIVGARQDDEDELGLNTLNNAGSAYIFERDTNGVWKEIQKIVASDREAVDAFGRSVSISGDYVVVGANFEDHDEIGANFMISAGSAYIFERDTNGVWQEVQKIVANDRGVDDEFGEKVFISENHIIVGAFLEDEDALGGNTLSSAGAAYIFERDINGVWSQVEKLVASDRADSDKFGWSVSINKDYAIVGARHEDEDVSGSNTMSKAGTAYIFERDAGGNWNEIQKIVASDRAVDDFFGSDVAIDGNFAVVSSIREDEDALGNNTISQTGSAYIFERDINGVWKEVEKIVASDRAINDRFGISVDISGSNIMVGAYFEDHNVVGVDSLLAAGSVYIFCGHTASPIATNWTNDTLCEENIDSTYFTTYLSLSNELPDSMIWTFDDTATGITTISNLQNPAHLFEKSGLYNVSLVLYWACSRDTFYYTVSIYKIPSTVIMRDTSICQYDNIVLGGLIQNTSGVYHDTFISINGCDSIIETTLTINHCENDIYIPSAFSPNEDGVNDFFTPRSKGLNDVHVQIFDRWGKKIFEIDNSSLSWNGKSDKGLLQNEGVYVYVFTASSIDGEILVRKGNVSLIR